jgi:AcrR family transcriptional regulator
MAVASRPRLTRAPHAHSMPAQAGSTRGKHAGRATADCEGVSEIQRTRLLFAMADLAREHGAGQITVSHIVARSGVSRRTFYELFDGREACFLAAFDEAVERAEKRLAPALAAGGSWRERVRAGLGALLDFIEDEPGLGALCVVEALGAGPLARERRAAVVQTLIEAVDEGRGMARGNVRLTRLTAEGVVGAVLAVLHARLCERATPEMSGLLSPLMGIIVLPYLGSAAAARESSRPTPPHRRTTRPQSDPLRDLDMRLTYRTVRVLLAIAARPGASNRKIADAAGVVDQGQISKLLGRLEHLELIENAGAAPGEPNVWSLTARGRELEQTVLRRNTPTATDVKQL